MKIRWNHRYVQLGVTAFLVIAASILFYYGIFHMKSLVTGIKTFFSIMAPIIYGAAIAYLLTPIVNFLERKIIFPIFEKRHKTLQKKGRKVVRWICVILSVFFMFLIIYALVMMILPQLIRSIMNIIYSFPHYVNVVENWLNSVVEKVEAESGYDQPDQPVFKLIAGISDKYDPSSDAVHDEKHICEFSGSSCFFEEFPYWSDCITLYPGR